MSGPLDFDLLIRDSEFNRQITRIEQRVMGMSRKVVQETNAIDEQFKRLALTATGLFTFGQLSQLPMQILKVRGEFESLEIAFTTLLRSKSKADALMGQIVDTAASTPFGVKDLAAGAKQLLAYGSNASTVIREMRMLGDVASGVSAPINDLIYLYGTLRSQGRAYAVDIRQFTGRGVPLLQSLADVMKVNVSQVNDLVSAGKVGFPEVEKAFQLMTGAGGMFQNMMANQSQSLAALTDRLGDKWNAMLNDIGKKNQGVMSEVINVATEAVEHYEPIIDVLTVIAATYGTYKAAILTVSAAQKASAAMTQLVALEMSLAAAANETLTVAQARQVVVSKLLQRAQMALNTTMMANPYVAVATAIAALATAYFVFKEEAIEVKSAQELLAGSTRDVLRDFRQQSTEIQTLIGVIGNQNIAESERLKAYDKLKSIAPDIVQGLDFQRAKTADLTAATNEYLVSLEKKIRLESRQGAFKEAIDQDLDADERIKKAQERVVAERKKVRSTGGGGVQTGLDARGSTAVSGFAVGAAERELEQAVAAKKKTEQALNSVRQSVESVYSGSDGKEAINARLSELELVRSSLTNKLSPAYKQVEDEITSLTKQRDKLTASEKAGQVVAAKTVAQYDEEIKKLKESQEQSSSRAQYDNYQKQIDQLTKQKNRLTGAQTAAEKKAAKDADKVGPFGSLSYWDNVAKKADEVLQKTPSTDTGKIAQQMAIKADAEQRAAEIRKSQEIKTYEEQLDEFRKQYELYTKWVQYVDQDSADLRYSDLLSKGRTYVDYLNKEIARLEAKQKEGGLNKQEGENLLLLNTQRDDATGKKTAIQTFTENLETAQQKAASLTDYLATLQTQQDELAGNNTDFGLEARKIIAEEMVQAQRQRREQLQQFLQDVVGSEQQQTATRKRYSDLRTELDKQYTDKKSASYQKALSEINKAEENDLKDVRERAAQARDEFKKLDDVIVERGRAALRKRLELLKEYLRTATDEEKKSQTFIGKQKEADDLTIEIDNQTIDDVKTFASIAGELGDALGQVNGSLGQTGQLMSGLAQSASLVTVAFDKNAETSDKIAAGVQGAVGLFNILISSAAQRDQAEQQYYRNAIAAEQQYQVLLNEQIGLQSELSENVFVKNYQGRLKDGVAKLNDANKAYQESIKKLAEGRAKVGQGNAVDAGNIGKGIGSGAAMGAAIGSIVPGLGTAIGAVAGGIVGGLVGLFGGKKKQDEFGSLLEKYPALVKKGADGWEELDENLAATLIDQEQVDENTKQLLQNTIEWQKQMDEAKEQIKGVISELASGLGDGLRDNLVESFRAGEDAAQAFGDSVGKVIEDMVAKLLFNQVFSAQFDKLQQEMQASFDGGDGDWVDDLGRFYQTAGALSQQFNDGLAAAQKQAEQYGIKIFSPTDDAASKKNTGLSGAVKGVSEETASVLAGQINAMRITQAETLISIRNILMTLGQIEVNTRRLESIDDTLKQMKDTNPLRSKGIGG